MFYPLIATIIFGINNSDHDNIHFCVILLQSPQVLLSIIHTIFVISWICMAPNCLSFYYWTSHIFPSSRVSELKIKEKIVRQDNNNNNNNNNNDNDENMIEKNKDHCYMFHLIQKIYSTRCDILYVQPIRKVIINDKFGNDIGDIISSYLPRYDLKQLLHNLEMDWEARQVSNILDNVI